jgi:KipI family sensor histidine kinase inhibitor
MGAQAALLQPERGDGRVNTRGRLDRMQVRPAGAHAVLVDVDDTAAALSLARFVRASAVAMTEVVPGAASVLLDGLDRLDAAGRAALDDVLAAWTPDADLPAGHQEDEAVEVVEVPVVYDGADLDDVAARGGTDRDGVVARHTGLELVSAFCGFAPGFAYLAGLPDELAVPRLETPRTRVPAGAVALADRWCGVYPTASPGGWRLIGRTDAVLWDPARERPALLAPGTRVRFTAR